MGVLLFRGTASCTGARLGAFVPACGSASGGTYSPYVGSRSGVTAGVALRADPTVPGRSRTGSSRNPNATNEASTTGTTKAPATTPIRTPRDDRASTSSSAAHSFG
ncbi:hypothetical protein E1287_35860 [Actinomadura sp. KC06]|uniref:hypothetical protein n=1 Tax=Actinomadura sp. KC06 TaxID=2530369 RepID=UPI0010505917|nr:hypothetical protein [Actinomadura sp. KC06]TDD26784.1 hypothetical protein E1287_35860 [Actinomadura sp. KC06]